MGISPKFNWKLQANANGPRRGFSMRFTENKRNSFSWLIDLAVLFLFFFRKITRKCGFLWSNFTDTFLGLTNQLIFLGMSFPRLVFHVFLTDEEFFIILESNIVASQFSWVNHPLDMNILEPEPIRISWKAEVASEHRMGGQNLQVFVAPWRLCGKSIEGAVKTQRLVSQLMAFFGGYCDLRGTWRIIPGLGYVVNNHG